MALSMAARVFLFIAFLYTNAAKQSYFTDWQVQDERLHQPTCVNIPHNLTLCRGIGYAKMRLPNLLDHDSITEITQQASSWVPVRNVKCHPDAQLFLCSLFTPVCLDRPIYPCRSLCEHVKAGCESFVKRFGFPWPEILRCDKFPLDNDMCITIQTKKQRSDSKGATSQCNVCQEEADLLNIMESYCNSDFVLASRLKRKKRNKVMSIHPKLYKGSISDTPKSKKYRIQLSDEKCCRDVGKKNQSRYLIMGIKGRKQNLLPLLIIPINGKSKKNIEEATHIFSSFDCSPYLNKRVQKRRGQVHLKRINNTLD